MTCSSVAEHYHSSAKERDAESGLDYFGARYYASSMGRWMSPDWSAKEEPVPYANLDNPQTLNLYGYVGNNPVSKADADGHCPWCVGFLVGAGIGAGIEAYHEYKAGNGYDSSKIAGKALQGGVTGAVAVATGGSSLIVQGLAVGAANVGTGMAVRALQKDPNAHALDKKEVRSGAASGVAGGVLGGAAGNAVTNEVGAMTTSIEVQGAQASRQVMSGLISGDASQVAAGQAARTSATMEGAITGGAASTASNAVSTAASEAATAANNRIKH
ncbi:MAG TPA: RHS repeat-associated core domain-containing protein [Acidobacteriaceae bacterium]|jgi:RHS repeat-associated protein|nr:RHS repeat-associated core domain-containing protein [Acidobacteriaceae bacterium]